MRAAFSDEKASFAELRGLDPFLRDHVLLHGDMSKENVLWNGKQVALVDMYSSGVSANGNSIV